VGQTIVRVDSRYFRPTEVETLLGDASAAHRKLGWRPKTTFAELVTEMMREDMLIAQRDAMCQEQGFKTFKYHE
jgi:GDPmannose 4,6-dehydratase